MAERSRLLQFSPIFPVRDLGAALAHYVTLGFEVERYADGDDYGFAIRDGLCLHLTARSDYYPGGNLSVAYLLVEDADALADEWSRNGVGGFTNPPVDTPWRMREGTHFDLDKNLIRYGSPLARRRRKTTSPAAGTAGAGGAGAAGAAS
jgi:hypothetical protein